jgi:mannose-6-phosphate isomerase-like protein (cupin superfamily)
MGKNVVNLQEKLGRFSDFWAPRVVAEMNEYQFKLVKIHGEFVWHQHKDTDEVFLVVDGWMTIDFRDSAVSLGPGELFVVPKGVEHRTSSTEPCSLLLVEPRGVVNTGETGGEMTAANDVWI